MLRDFFYKSYLAEGEEIQFAIHRHIFMQAKDFFRITFFGIFLPLFIWWLFPQTILFAAIWLGMGILRFFYEFVDWYYDVWLVTNASVIEILWEGFFKKSSARIEYHIIQGIGYEVKGFIPTLFNYGIIVLEKFAGNPSVFLGAVNPKKKTEMLTRAQEQFVTNKSFRDHRALQGVLTDLLQRHIVEYGVEEEKTNDE
jgi:hypothetical protein